MNAHLSWHKTSQTNLPLLLASFLCSHLNSTKHTGNQKAIHLQVSWKLSCSNYLSSLLKQQISTKYPVFYRGKVWKWTLRAPQPVNSFHWHFCWKYILTYSEILTLRLLYILANTRSTKFRNFQNSTFIFLSLFSVVNRGSGSLQVSLHQTVAKTTEHHCSTKLIW